ncbi:MAG: NADPH-dependent F420 reductase [Candidatus Dormibacteria bacterium]
MESTRIGILGGTGDLGRGLALRLARSEPVLLGSRDPARAQATAAELGHALGGRGVPALDLRGGANREAAGCPVVIVAVPAGALAATLDEVAEAAAPGSTWISAVNPLKRAAGAFRYAPEVIAPGVTSAAAYLAARLPGAHVAGAFHPLSADDLADLDRRLDGDMFVFGDDPGAVEVALHLGELVEGVSAYPCGGLEQAPVVEGLVPLMFNAAFPRGMHRPALRLTGH